MTSFAWDVPIATLPAYITPGSIPAPSLLPDRTLRWVLRWRSDVIVAADGTEQRASLATVPRQSFASAFLLGDADTRTLRSALLVGASSVYELVLPYEATPALAAVVGASVTVAPTYCDWIAVGRRVLIAGPGGVWTASITAHAAGVLTLNASPPAGSFPASATHVYPLEDVLLEDAQPLSRSPVNLTRWSFAARQRTAVALPAAGATVDRYDDLPVLAERPYLAGADGEQFLGAIDFFDAGGAVSSTTLRPIAQIQRAGTWLITTAAWRQWWKAFLSELRGRWRTFLLPTWRDDLTRYSPPSASLDRLRVNEGYTALWWPSLAHRRLQLEDGDGNVEYATVTGSTQDGPYDTLQLDHEVMSAPVRVSFLEVVRLASDDVVIEYDGRWIGRVTLSVVTVSK